MSKLGGLVEFLSFTVAKDNGSNYFAANSPSYPEITFFALEETEALSGLKLVLAEIDLEEESA